MRAQCAERIECGGPGVTVFRAAGSECKERRVFTHAHYPITEPRVHLVTRAYLQRLCGVNLAWLAEQSGVAAGARGGAEKSAKAAPK